MSPFRITHIPPHSRRDGRQPDHHFRESPFLSPYVVSATLSVANVGRNRPARKRCQCGALHKALCTQALTNLQIAL